VFKGADGRHDIGHGALRAYPATESEQAAAMAQYADWYAMCVYQPLGRSTVPEKKTIERPPRRARKAASTPAAGRRTARVNPRQHKRAKEERVGDFR